jgi:hypothetical protein
MYKCISLRYKNKEALCKHHDLTRVLRLGTLLGITAQGCFEQAAAAYSCAAAPSGSDVPHKYKQSNGKVRVILQQEVWYNTYLAMGCFPQA